jgi:hypothetical protein
MLSEKIWLKWNANTILWNDNPYLWNEVYVMQKVVENFGGGGGGFYVNPSSRDQWRGIKKQLKQKGLTDDETKKFLEIVVRVNGLENKEAREYEKIEKSITIEHVRNVISLLDPSTKTVRVKVNKDKNK